MDELGEVPTGRCPYQGEATVVLDETFNGTEIRDIASDYVLRLEPPDD